MYYVSTGDVPYIDIQKLLNERHKKWMQIYKQNIHILKLHNHKHKNNIRLHNHNNKLRGTLFPLCPTETTADNHTIFKQ